MAAALSAVVLILAALFSPQRAAGALPSDNPCGLSRQDRMAAITRIDITSVRRVPNIRQEVEAQQPRAIRLRLGAVGHSSRSQEIAAFSASTAIADALQNAANHSLIG
jgi:hypothetical protein